MTTSLSAPPALSASGEPSRHLGHTDAGTIGLEGLTFDGHHGYYRGERTRARPFGVDLQVGW